MMDSIGLAKAIELQNQAREAQWRGNDDLFYLDYGYEPWPLFAWIGRMLAGLRTHGKAIKKRTGWRSAGPPAMRRIAAVRPLLAAYSLRCIRPRS